MGVSSEVMFCSFDVLGVSSEVPRFSSEVFGVRSKVLGLSSEALGFSFERLGFSSEVLVFRSYVLCVALTSWGLAPWLSDFNSRGPGLSILVLGVCSKVLCFTGDGIHLASKQ